MEGGIKGVGGMGGAAGGATFTRMGSPEMNGLKPKAPEVAGLATESVSPASPDQATGSEPAARLEATAITGGPGKTFRALGEGAFRFFGNAVKSPDTSINTQQSAPSREVDSDRADHDREVDNDRAAAEDTLKAREARDAEETTEEGTATSVETNPIGLGNQGQSSEMNTQAAELRDKLGDLQPIRVSTGAQAEQSGVVPPTGETTTEQSDRNTTQVPEQNTPQTVEQRLQNVRIASATITIGE